MNTKLCISTALYCESKLELSIKLKYFNLLSRICAYKTNRYSRTLYLITGRAANFAGYANYL